MTMLRIRHLLLFGLLAIGANLSDEFAIGGQVDPIFRQSTTLSSPAEFDLVRRSIRISSIQGSNDQHYSHTTDWPDQFIRDEWANDGHITSISQADGHWTVFMSKHTGINRQAWATRSDFQTAFHYAQTAWDRPVTEITYRDGTWAVAASDIAGLTDQVFVVQASFPDDFINSKQSEGYYISDIAYGSREWAIVLSKIASFGDQVYHRSGTFPADFVKSNWRNGYYITEVGFGESQWIVVMTKLGSGEQTWLLGHNWQEVSFHAEFPVEEIETAWNHGLQVLDLINDSDNYILVTTTDLSGVIGAPPPTGGVLDTTIIASSSGSVTFSADIFAVGSDLQSLSLDRDDLSICPAETRFLFEQSSAPSYYQQTNKGPYSATFLFDQSGSITDTDPADIRIDAAKMFLNSMSTGDEVGLLSFSGSSTNRHTDVHNRNFTTDSTGFDPAFDYLARSEGGGTPLYDAVINAVAYTADGASNQNRAVIVFTDGRDTTSTSTIYDAIDYANSRHTPLHTIALSDGVNIEVLSNMARQTGGSFAKASDVRQLISHFGVLGRYLSGTGTFNRTEWRITPHEGGTFSFDEGDILTSCIAIAVSGGRSIEVPFSVEFDGGRPGLVSELADWLTQVSVDGRSGTWNTGRVPAVSGGPQIDVTANTTVVNGGTSDVVVQTSGSLQSLIIAEADSTRGYYEVPVMASTVTLQLELAQDISVPSLNLTFAGRGESNSVGPYTTYEFDVVTVGTGDVQVTLSWNVDSDVDLHVVDPNGEEIYYGNRSSVSGGELDLDSNAGCSIDGVRNENITWPTGAAPEGTYTVRVDYWSSCGVESTNYTVRVNNGGESRVFSGTFTGLGNFGGAGDGREVASFERR